MGLRIQLLVAFCGLASVVIWLASSITAVILTGVLSLIGILIFIASRHVQILKARQRLKWPALRAKDTATTVPVRVDTAHDYYLFILGSGGHTKEMLMMMDDGYSSFHSFHRRYLISSGDTMSSNHLEDFEQDLKQRCAHDGTEPGTYDKVFVARARRVHQKLWSVPFSALLSMVDICKVLMSAPKSAVGQQIRWPGIIFSNGPATGFFVALVAHILKILHVAPQDTMRIVYIESWARISTLSVTGKLFFHTGLADLFLVQHEEVAKKYDVVNAGPMVFNARKFNEE